MIVAGQPSSNSSEADPPPAEEAPTVHGFQESGLHQAPLPWWSVHALPSLPSVKQKLLRPFFGAGIGLRSSHVLRWSYWRQVRQYHRIDDLPHAW